MAKTTVEEFIAFLQAVETNNVLGDKAYVEIIQQVLDDIYADNSKARRYKPEPYATTTDGTLTYDWLTIFPSLAIGDAEWTSIRYIKGLYKPGLQASDINDYGRTAIPSFDQERYDKRVYDADVVIDNEQQTVKFLVDPDDTTDVWRADVWLKAPELSLLATTTPIPLLDGWDKRLLLPGCRGWFEELDTGEPGPQAALFWKRLLEYRDALERVAEVDSYSNEESRYKMKAPNVIPQ